MLYLCVFPMKCPYCNGDDHKVVDKRESADSEAIRRRRECLSCNRRFTTHERIDLTPVMIIKKENTREVFDSLKLRKGILRATEKRPVNAEQIDHIVETVEAKIRSKYGKEVESKKIGDLTMRELRKVDKVAYIRFASVYRDFQDVESFVNEIQKLLKR